VEGTGRSKKCLRAPRVDGVILSSEAMLAPPTGGSHTGDAVNLGTLGRKNVLLWCERRRGDGSGANG
jgi:hypothetical protein